MDEKMNESARFKTMPLNKIDTESLGEQICGEWSSGSENRSEFLEKREEYTANWRDLNKQDTQGPWENSSNFNVPLVLFYGKAIHARLWQMFSNKNTFFGVKARQEAFQDKEVAIQNFMRFILNDYCNAKNGCRDVMDESLWDNVFDGSWFIKVYWQRDTHKFVDSVPVVEVTEKVTFDSNNITGVTGYDTKQTEKEVVKEEIIETPWIARCNLEDMMMPQGQGDPQTADYVSHRVFMSTDTLKARGYEGKFDSDVVEECLEHHNSFMNSDQESSIKRQRAEEEGYNDRDGYYRNYHVRS